MSKPHVSIPQSAIQQVIDDYLAGVSTTDLAARHDVTPSTVSYLLKKAGIPLRTRSEINRLRAPIDDERLRHLNDEAVLSQAAIAQQLGVSLPTIERAMRRLGLKSKKGRGSPMEKNYFWTGGRRLDKHGYVLVKANGHPHANNCGYVREHRLVMEKVLGRHLQPSEVVHHKDGNRQNNYPDNLEVFASNSVHFLADHNDHPRCPVTGRFLRKQANLQRQDRL